MQGPLEKFTPERWDIIKRILSGQDENKVSLGAAAREAGVSIADIRGWVKRSRESQPDDDPLVMEIAEFYDSIKELQSGFVEDEIWKRGFTGVTEDVWHKGEVVGQKTTPDSRILMRVLETRNDDYKKSHAPVIALGSTEEVFAKLLAGERLALAEQDAIKDKREAENDTIDLEDTEYYGTT